MCQKGIKLFHFAEIDIFRIPEKAPSENPLEGLRFFSDQKKTFFEKFLYLVPPSIPEWAKRSEIFFFFDMA